MASQTARAAIRAWLAANWSAVPVVHENESFLDAEPPAAWIMVEMSGRFYEQASIGSGSPAAERWVESGALYAHVMVPVGTGDATAATHAEALADLLRGAEPGSSIRFRGMSIGDGTVADEAGKWFRLTLRAEWERG